MKKFDFPVRKNRTEKKSTYKPPKKPTTAMELLLEASRWIERVELASASLEKLKKEANQKIAKASLAVKRQMKRESK